MAMQSGFIKRIRDIMRMDAGINGDAQRIEQMVWMLFLKVYDAKEDDWELNEDNYESIIPEDLRWRNWAKADGNGHAMTGDKLLNFVNNTLFPVLKGNDIKAGDTVIYEGIKVTPSTPAKKAIVKSTFEDANNYMKDGVYLRQVIDVIDEIEFDDVKESHAFGFVYEEILRELQSAGSSGEFYTPRAVTEFMAMMIQPKLGEKMADFACGTGGFITSWLGQLSKQVTDTTAQKQLDDSIYGIEKKPFPYLLCVTNMLLHDIEVPNIYHTNSLKHNLLDYTDDDKFDVILMNPPYGGHEDKSIYNFFPNDLVSSETSDLFMSVIMYRLKKGGRCAVVISDGFLSSIDDSAKVNIKKKLVSEFNLHTIIRLPSSVFAPYTDIPTNILFFDNTHPTRNTWYYRLDMPSDRKHFSKTKPMEIAHFAPVLEWWENRTEIKDVLPKENMVETWKAQCVSVDAIIENSYALNFCDYPPNEQVVLTPDEVVSMYVSKRQSLESKLSAATASLQDCLNGLSMSSLTNIGDLAYQLSELNKSFPTDLRRSVLKAAVRGQLLAQKSEEHCAEIAAIDEIEDVPYSIPESWRWVRLSSLCIYLQRGKSPKYSTIEKIPVVSQKCNQWDGFQLDKARFIDPETLSAYSEERMLVNGDILINSTGLGTLGRAAIYSDCKNPYGIAVADSHVTVARLNEKAILPEYLYAYWANPSVQFIIESQATGSTKQKELGLKLIQNYPIPLPPLAEQKRIVAKLEEILPLCERLK